MVKGSQQLTSQARVHLYELIFNVYGVYYFRLYQSNRLKHKVRMVVLYLYSPVVMIFN